jgi:hypothetical protein
MVAMPIGERQAALISSAGGNPWPGATLSM